MYEFAKSLIYGFFYSFEQQYSHHIDLENKWENYIRIGLYPEKSQ